MFIGDGDSSRAFKAVTEMKPYGNREIAKLECIVHIQKRMSSWAKKLKKWCEGKKPDDAETYQHKVVLLTNRYILCNIITQKL